MDHTHWFGQSGKLRNQLIHCLLEVYSWTRWPILLTLHLGKYDLLWAWAAELINVDLPPLLVLDLATFSILLGWFLLPVQAWCESTIQRRLIKVEEKVNCIIHILFIQWLRGRGIPQPGIGFGLPHVFSGDCIHLSWWMLFCTWTIWRPESIELVKVTAGLPLKGQVDKRQVGHSHTESGQLYSARLLYQFGKLESPLATLIHFICIETQVGDWATLRWEVAWSGRNCWLYCFQY